MSVLVTQFFLTVSFFLELRRCSRARLSCEVKYCVLACQGSSSPAGLLSWLEGGATSAAHNFDFSKARCIHMDASGSFFPGARHRQNVEPVAKHGGAEHEAVPRPKHLIKTLGYKFGLRKCQGPSCASIIPGAIANTRPRDFHLRASEHAGQLRICSPVGRVGVPTGFNDPWRKRRWSGRWVCIFLRAA